jgi:hypothetical protein
VDDHRQHDAAGGLPAVDVLDELENGIGERIRGLAQLPAT